MKINLSKRDAVWSLIGTFLSMGVNFIMLPFILHFLDDDSVGFYYILTSLSGIVVMFDFGFSPSISRNMAYAWCGAKNLQKQGGDVGNHIEPNYELMKAIVSTCKRIYFTISFFALLLCATLGSIYIFSITRGYNKQRYFWAWGIYAFAIVVNLLVGYYTVFLRGVGAVSQANKATVYSRIIQIVLTIVFLVSGFGILGVALAYFLYGITFRVLANRYFVHFHNIGHKLKIITVNNQDYHWKRILGIIWSSTWRDGIVTVSNYILNQSTTIIASLYLTLYETGLYSQSVQLMSAIAQIAGTMYTAYQPALQSAYVNGQKMKQRDYMSAIIVSFVILFVLGTIVLIIVGLPMIRLIKPSYTVQIPLLLAVGLYQFILKYRNAYTSFLSTTNRIIYSRAFLVSAFICIGLSILFTGVLEYGVYGLVIAQIISQIVYNVWRWSMMVHKELQYSYIDTFRYGTAELLQFVSKKEKR
jgi:O-antigen/teichoic acid export membrane protein